MAYHIYTTRAIILASRAEGDGHKVLTLLTEELGILNAHAQSIRTLKSKLRYHLQDYCFSRVSLVRGRVLWRITGAETLSRAHLVDPRSRALVVEACALASVITLPDDPHTDLFEDMRVLLEYFGTCEYVDTTSSDALLLTQLRIFSRTGFLPEYENLKSLVGSQELSREALARFAMHREEGRRLARATLLSVQL